ncbi:hypothetical protein E2C01_023285 [Portunus trituberculatus]|uniref:Secreted protein n=1 Tax=Portunus trituberculatus TaxID=210409 RepID=A0A5B7E7L4_PORTR|nr:hypothetical protein [Portunus trituberculatus]
MAQPAGSCSTIVMVVVVLMVVTKATEASASYSLTTPAAPSHSPPESTSEDRLAVGILGVTTQYWCRAEFCTKEENHHVDRIFLLGASRVWRVRGGGQQHMPSSAPNSASLNFLSLGWVHEFPPAPTPLFPFYTYIHTYEHCRLKCLFPSPSHVCLPFLSVPLYIV